MTWVKTKIRYMPKTEVFRIPDFQPQLGSLSHTHTTSIDQKDNQSEYR